MGSVEHPQRKAHDRQMRDRFLRLTAGLSHGIHERDEAFALGLLALLAGESLFLLGPPEAWQLAGTNRVAVTAAYTNVTGQVGFALGAYDAGQPLFVRSELLHSPYIEEYASARAGSNWNIS